MKFFISRVLIAFMCLVGAVALLAGPSSAAQAQRAQPTRTPLPQPTEISPTPAPSGPETWRPSATALSLAQLRLTDRTLRGPVAATTYEIALPPDWRLTGPGRLFLSLSTALPPNTATLSNTAGIASGTRAPARLHLSINGVGLPDIVLDQAENRIIPIALPAEALAVRAPYERHLLSVQLDDQAQCNADQQVSLIVHNGTQIDLPHTEDSGAPDLRHLPWPLYQQSLVSDAATVLVPDHPSAANLRAALTLMAGLSRMTAGQLGMTLTTLSQMTQVQWSDSHIILVGLPNQFPMLRDMVLPLAISNNSASFADVAPTDGVLQLARSPWGKGRVALLVSGNSDDAIDKAARALSQGDVHPGDIPNLAVVTQVQAPTRLTLPENFTLADLGYEAQTFESGGSHIRLFNFDLPNDKTGNDQAYFDLSYVHSPLLDYGQSSLAVALNGQNIGAVRFDDNSTKLSVSRVTLPKTALRPGRNELRLTADLRARDACAVGLNEWAALRPESRLHIPLVDAAEAPLPRRLALMSYPRLLLTQAALSNVAFVVSADEPGTWATAGRLAQDLGRRSLDEVLNLELSFADRVPEEMRQARHLIIVGKPASLPILGELAKVMPAPFQPGTNTADEPKAQVKYTLPSGADLGYLELLAAPWSEQRAVLAVLGNSDTGVAEAAAALISPDLRAKMNGNLTVINKGQLDASDIAVQTNALRAVDPSSAGESTNTPAVAATPNAEAPAWLIPAVIGSVALLLLLLLVSLLLTRNRRRGRTIEIEEE